MSTAQQEPVSKPPPLISAIWSRGGAAIRERAPSGRCQLNLEASAQAECALAVARISTGLASAHAPLQAEQCKEQV